MLQSSFNPTPSDADLVRAAQKGEQIAFEQLVTRYFPWVFTIAHASMRHPETAEDLTQEAFIRAYLYLGKLREPEKFAPWMGRITRNLVSDWIVDHRRRSSILAMTPFEDAVEFVSDKKQIGSREVAENKEEHKAVHEALFGLPVDQREVVMLRYFEDFSRKEIALHLGINPATVWRLLRKARITMKKSIESTLRDAAPAFRSSAKATKSTLALIATVSALSSQSKAAVMLAAGGEAWATTLTTTVSTGAFGASTATAGKVFLGGVVTKTQAILVAMVVVLGTTGIVMDVSDEGKLPDKAVVTSEPISSGSQSSGTNPVTEEKPLVQNGNSLPKVTTVAVPALAKKGEEWIDTGLHASNDEFLFFRATGKALSNPGGTQYDPNGNVSAGPARLTTLRDGVHLNENAPESSLVGKIGENGTPFLVGASHVIRASEEGTLFLGFNDNYSGFHDNSGEFTAYVYLDTPQSEIHQCQLNLLLLNEARECAPPTLAHIMVQGDSLTKRPVCPSGGIYDTDIESATSVCSHHKLETHINIKDDFDGSLGLNWEIENENKSHYSLEKNPGALTITTEEGAFVNRHTSYKNMFLLPINAQKDETVQITTCLTSFTPSSESGYKHAGLLFWNDADNYIKWAAFPAYSDAHNFSVVTETKGYRLTRRQLTEREHHEKTWLRIIKHDNQYTFHVSYDGENYAQFICPPAHYTINKKTPERVPMTNGKVPWGDGEVAKVGLFALDNGDPIDDPGTDATFEFFRVEVLPNDAKEKNVDEGNSTKEGERTIEPAGLRADPVFSFLKKVFLNDAMEKRFAKRTSTKKDERAIEPAGLRADFAFSIFPNLKTEVGEVVFKGKYEHLSRGGAYSTPGEIQLLKSDRGAITAVSSFPNTWGVVVASGDEDHRLTTCRAGVQRDGKNYWSTLKIHDDRIVSSFSKPNTALVKKEMVVPQGALYDPNSWPDTYCAANILLRGFDLKEGDAKEFKAYDVDNAGTGYSGYTFKVEHKGKVQVSVPAGVFMANHLVLTQLTSGDTWFMKRAGHQTEFWVLDNDVIVRILRHREPYEMRLSSCTDVETLPGYITTVVVPARFKKGEEWVDTGLRALENEILYLQGIGYAANWYYNYSDANGLVSSLAKVSEKEFGPYLHSDSPKACLVGKIGEKGTPFTVGTSRVIRTSGGKLFLGYNDSNTRTYDNSGSFTAYVYRGESQSDLHKCQMNLLVLQEAKVRWASDNDPSALPTWEDLIRGNYLKEQPICPFGGTYFIGTPEGLPSCSHMIPKGEGSQPKKVSGWTTADGKAIINGKASGPSIVANPSFEQGVDGGVPPWRLVTWLGSCGFGVDSKVAHDGTRSVKISSKSGGSASWIQTLTVLPNTLYSASCWIKTLDVTGDAGCGAVFRVLPSSSTGTKAITQSKSLAGTNDWTQVKVRFNTGPNSSINIGCLFGGAGKSVGKGWFDGIEFNPITLDESANVNVNVTSGNDK